MSQSNSYPLLYSLVSLGRYHCPITFKEFTEHSHIVAIKPTGNVYSYDGIEELNIRPKHMKDLLDDTPFTKSDIITIQDPNNLERRNLAAFHHIKLGIRAEDYMPSVTSRDIAIPENLKKQLNEVSAKHELEMKKKHEELSKMPDKSYAVRRERRNSVFSKR